MNRWSLLAACLAVATCSWAVAPQRTFVASYGKDSSPTCSLTAPCRGFQTAIDVVASGGEVVALDSAGYGAMTITRAISVVAPQGVHAAITVFGTTGVEIATPANAAVTLRGLVISNASNPVGVKGVNNSAGANLRIENCTIDGFATSVRQASPGILHIADSRLTRGSLSIGSAGAPVRFSIERTYLAPDPLVSSHTVIVNNGRGVIKDSTLEGDGTHASFGIETQNDASAPGPVELQLENSVIQGHFRGVLSDATYGAYTSVSITHCQILRNGTGVVTVHGGALALVSTTIAHNDIGVGVDAGGGPAFTDGRNWFGFNGADFGSGAALVGPGGVK